MNEHLPHQTELYMHSDHDIFSDFQHCNAQELVQYGTQLAHAFPMAKAAYPLPTNQIYHQLIQICQHNN